MGNQSIFLSHTRRDGHIITTDVIPLLVAEGLDYHFINSAMGNAAEHALYIEESILISSIFVVCVSVNSVDSPWVSRETAFALRHKSSASIVALALDSTMPVQVNSELDTRPLFALREQDALLRLSHYARNAPNHCMHRSGGGLRFINGKPTPAAR